MKNISFPQTNAAHRQYTIIIHPFSEMFIFSVAMAKCLPLYKPNTRRAHVDDDDDDGGDEEEEEELKVGKYSL